MEIPPIWDELLQPLFIIKTFTNSVEGDLHMQYHAYKACKEAIEHLSMIYDNEVASYFKTYLESRFSSTLDIRISHLSYMFTEDGLNDYREKDCIEKEELIEIFNEFACDTMAIEVVQENFLIAGIFSFLQKKN